jgi:RNA polymerase sigma factor (sigma-70 family)
MTDNLAKDDKGGTEKGRAAGSDAVSQWFTREILPHEALLMHYLRRNWQNASDVVDLRQEVYARVFDAAREAIPENPKRFMLATARNLLINLVKREHVVQIEIVADLDMLAIASEGPQPDSVAVARDELKRLQRALDQLPPKLREVIVLTYIEDLRLREIAVRLRVNKSTVSRQLASALQKLTDLLHSDSEPNRNE